MASCDVVGGRCRTWVGLAIVLVVLIGCGGDRPKTYPVKGKMVFDKGDIKLLAGSSLVCQQQQEPFYQAQGDIQEDGTFELKTRGKGEMLPGAVEGTYRAWVSLSTENGSEERQFRKIGIDPRFLSGTASDLTFKVPADGEVVLTVTKAQPGARLIPQPEGKINVRCGESDDLEAPADDAAPLIEGREPLHRPDVTAPPAAAKP